MSVKINQFELENVKRIKAVKVELSENGLTVIGGRNGQVCDLCPGYGQVCDLCGDNFTIKEKAA